LIAGVLFLFTLYWGVHWVRHWLIFEPYEDDIENFDSEFNNILENCPKITNDTVLVIDLKDLDINKTRMVTILA
jgi:hypothetical protein